MLLQAGLPMLSLDKRNPHLISFIKSHPLRINILTAFTSLFIIIVITIIAYTSYNNSNSILKVSDALFNQVTDMVTEKTTNYLKPAAILAELNSKIFEKEVVVLDINRQKEFIASKKLTDFELYLLEILKSYPQLIMLYIGYEKGYFLKVDNSSGLKIGNIDKTGLVPLLYYKFIDNSDNVIKIEPANEFLNYNHKMRPWYKGAKNTGNLYWTDMYIFFSTREPGITAAHSLTDKNRQFLGVMGVDIKLEALSKFLKTLKISKSGFTFIINCYFPR